MTSDAFGMPTERRAPSKLGYWLGGAVIALAIVGAIAWFALGLAGLGDRVDDLGRVAIPGRGVLELKAGKNAAYYEGTGSLRSLRIGLREVDGPAVRIGSHGGDVSYDIGGHSGRSVAGFTLAHAGRYELSVDGEPGTLAVGKGVGGRIVSSIVGGIVLFLGGCFLGGGLIAWTSRRRSRARGVV